MDELYPPMRCNTFPISAHISRDCTGLSNANQRMCFSAVGRCGAPAKNSINFHHRWIIPYLKEGSLSARHTSATYNTEIKPVTCIYHCWLELFIVYIRTAMDRLPQELVTHVASFIEREDHQYQLGLSCWRKPKSKLPPYATLSRRWQLAIELRTFRSLRLKSHELPYLAQVLVGHRRLFLSDLAYDIVLPTYDDKACAKFETKQDMERNNRAFTDAIHALFQFLKAWEDAGATMESCHLSLHLSDVYAPMDGRHRGLEKYEQDREQWYSNKRSDLWGHRYEHSILRLLEHPQLPTLSILSSFQMSLYEDRIVEPKSAVRLANKLSGVRTVALHLSDNEKKYPDIRRQSRYGRFHILSSILLDCLVTNKY